MGIPATKDNMMLENVIHSNIAQIAKNRDNRDPANRHKELSGEKLTGCGISCAKTTNTPYLMNRTNAIF
jgi:hypothetical protein